MYSPSPAPYALLLGEFGHTQGGFQFGGIKTVLLFQGISQASVLFVTVFYISVPNSPRLAKGWLSAFISDMKK